MLSKLFEDRGVIIDHTYQLNFGGNMDFKNMLERERLQSKKISKTQSVTSQISNGIDADDIHIGPSDHVPWLQGSQVGLHPHRGPRVRRHPDLDGAEARGVGLAQLGRRRHRCGPLRKVALDRGIGGPLLGPSAYFMKSPPVQYTDAEAHDLVEAFIKDEVVEMTSKLNAENFRAKHSNGNGNGNGHRSISVDTGRLA